MCLIIKICQFVSFMFLLIANHYLYSSSHLSVRIGLQVKKRNHERAMTVVVIVTTAGK